MSTRWVEVEMDLIKFGESHTVKPAAGRRSTVMAAVSQAFRRRYAVRPPQGSGFSFRVPERCARIP